MVAAHPGDTPVHVALRTSDVDEARAFCRKLFYGPLQVNPVGDTSGFAFAGEVVMLGPITVGEISYGVDINVTIADLETSYHVLAPLTGSLRSRHRGTAVVADRTRAALDQQIGSPLLLGESFDVADGPGRTWVALVRLLHAELCSEDGLAARPRMAARWRDMVISGLALTVEHPYGDEPAGPQEPRRPRTVKRALDAMHAEPWRQYKAGDLAAIAGVGVRVLQEAFRQHVGVPPLAYLRRLRLDGVHQELSRSDAWQVNVSEVAYRWGFTHLGRFAGAYRARFGESPSQTLRERR
jgi:AraC-like DNA-binding protein